MTHVRGTRSNEMRSTLRRVAVPAVSLSLALLLAGCGDRVQSVSSTPTPQPSASPPNSAQPTPGLSPSSRYKLALQLLQQGNATQARVELVQLWHEDPSDERGGVLIRQIDTDPKVVFGTESFPYTIKQGDTLFSLAKQYLHDSLNFYGLARYNGLTLPAHLQPGQVILIPGKPRPVRKWTPRVPTPPPATGTGTPPRQVSPPPTATPSSDSPARRRQAQDLRRRGLEQMSAGSIDRAVTLLSQAASLDPGNAAIAADLSRARRIQATVHNQ